MRSMKIDFDLERWGLFAVKKDAVYKNTRKGLETFYPKEGALLDFNGANNSADLGWKNEAGSST